MPKEDEDEPDYVRRWRQARKRILDPFAMLDRLIMLSSSSMQDVQQMEQSMPHQIVRYFVSRMINPR